MHTQDSTITPSSHLPTVEALLEKLDSMKGNIGAKERLEFLLREGPKVVPEFNFEDAFDMSRRAHTERVQKLVDLSSAVDTMKLRWHDSSLEDEVKKAGSRLIGHLTEFVRHAERKEARFEIETLESLWDDAPDVFPHFGLPTPSYYPAVKKEVPEPDEKVTAVKKAHQELVEEVTKENLEEAQLPTDDDIKQAFKEGWKASGISTSQIDEVKEELEAVGVRVDIQKPSSSRSSEFGDVVGSVSGRQLEKRELEPDIQQKSLDHLGLKQFNSSSPEEELEPELDMLDIRSWTLAINEVLASSWTFDRQLRGRVGDRARMGVTLIWKKDDEVLRLDIERLASDEVLVRMTPPRSSRKWSLEDEQTMYRVYAKEMKESQLRELHKDPSEFVKLILV